MVNSKNFSQLQNNYIISLWKISLWCSLLYETVTEPFSFSELINADSICIDVLDN
jgi:hypothetical protein